MLAQKRALSQRCRLCQFLNGKGGIFFVRNDVGIIISFNLVGWTNGRYITATATTGPGSGRPILYTQSAYKTFHILEGDYEFYRRDDDGKQD